MSRFNVGDFVVALHDDIDITRGKQYSIIRSSDESVFFVDDAGDRRDRGDLSNFQLVTNGGKVMARRTFKQIKDTVDTKKGMLWQEKCDDGDQPYSPLEGYSEFLKGDTNMQIEYGDRKLVEEQPDWFVEVFQVEPQYMTADELTRFEAFKKGITPKAIKIAKVEATPSRQSTAWTPERRAAQSRKMKAYRAKLRREEARRAA